MRAPKLPLAYREAKAYFYGLEFFVNRHTLIPRPETEQLVERTIELIRINQGVLPENLTILEVGTGSGNIAVTLDLRLRNAQIVATDISEHALEVAGRNAKRHQAKVDFSLADIAPAGGKFDLVIANLPYVPSSRLPHLPEEVRLEPRLAIDGGRDGLRVIKKLLSRLRELAKTRAIVALEIDDIQADKVTQLFRQEFPSWQISAEKDLAGFDRFVFGLSPDLAKR